MAIKTLAYQVDVNGISPSTIQRAGMQGSHNAVKLTFTIKSALKTNLQAYLTEHANSTFYYRFDGHSGTGKIQSTVPQELDLAADTVTKSYFLENWLTSDGGNIEVYFVITLVTASGTEEETEMEWYAFPAKIMLNAIPSGIDGSYDNLPSVTALADQAQRCAEIAEDCAEISVAARDRTELAQRKLEDGSTFIFDGGTSSGEMDVSLVVDDDVTSASGNPVKSQGIYQFVETKISAALSPLQTAISAIQSIVNTMVYVVESGTESVSYTANGNSANAEWRYRIWNDGTVECWAQKEVSTTVTNALWNGFGFSTGSLQELDLPYPSAITFSDKPVLNVTLSPDGMGGILMVPGSLETGSNTHTGRFEICRGTQQQEEVSFLVNYYAIGQIGEEEES